MKISSIFFLSFFLLITRTQAQEDAEGCKDHPMFNRMPNFYLYECSQNFAALDVVQQKNRHKTMKGT